MRRTGEPVLGLKQSDFTILENGKAQSIARLLIFESVDMAHSAERSYDQRAWLRRRGGMRMLESGRRICAIIG